MRLGLLALAGVLAACSSGGRSIPTPRPIIIFSGARLRVDEARMDSVYTWVTNEQLNIQDDPSFWVITLPTIGDTYPWEELNVRADSVSVRAPMGAQDTQVVYQIYGHLHLMATMGRQAEWLPEAPTATGYDLERAILSRTADAWILGRTVYNTGPYGPLDELAYAKEAGHLDAFIFTARPSEFVSERASWVRANPGAMERYREWFLDTFSREPPGLRTS
ncbi:MAG: hypothetical protein ABL963_10815 [Longimicrobiales bacterium]